MPGLFHQERDIRLLVLEGGGNLAQIWTREAERRDVGVRTIAAETWRQRLLFARERRTGAGAKDHADSLARQIIEWSGAKRPVSLRHDAAEAIAIGFWGVLDAGWLSEFPPELER